MLTPEQYELVFKSIRSNFNLTEDPEITIEANPGTVSYNRLVALRRIGINRISYGVQSANTEELRMLERAHNFFDVIEAVTSARKAGFDNLNLDLIYGLPEQTLFTWQTTVRRILHLHPEHILTGSFIIETMFGFPGIGRAYVQSIGQRDYSMIMGTTLIFAFLVALATLSVDIIYSFIDPRIRLDK